jgi:formylglycine-generating enzyme required for sulfatase activity
MAGNVSEFCQDWFMRNYCELKDARKNPAGPTEEQADMVDCSGKKVKARVLRGGDWSSPLRYCCSIHRGHQPYGPNPHYGFRIVVRLAQ